MPEVWLLSSGNLDKLYEFIKKAPHHKSIVFCNDDTRRIITDLLEINVMGFIDTRQPFIRQRQMLRRILHAFFCKTATGSDDVKCRHHLNYRESLLLKFFMQGLSAYEISKLTAMSVTIISAVKRGLMHKIGARSNQELYIYALGREYYFSTLQTRAMHNTLHPEQTRAIPLYSPSVL